MARLSGFLGLSSIIIMLAAASVVAQAPHERSEEPTGPRAVNARAVGEPSLRHPDGKLTPPTSMSQSAFSSSLPTEFRAPSDNVHERLLREYGAMFVARGGVKVPNAPAFDNHMDVASFQERLEKTVVKIGEIVLELQVPAAIALRNAIEDAGRERVRITPVDIDAAKRSYGDTIVLWASRVNPGLTHWVGKGKISQADADRIRRLSASEQVREIFKLEEQGIYFAKSLDKSIIYSVAPPGTSQHLSMLALDINEHANAKVREIMAKHGWYQTVVSDLPHFTFLGVAEDQLPKLGLKKKVDGGRTYWVPDI